MIDYDPMVVYDRVKHLSKVQGKPVSRMLEDLGLNKNTLYTIKSRGSFLASDTLAKIAFYLDTSVDYLLGGKSPENTNTRRIPVYGTVPAGIPVEAIEDILDYEEISFSDRIYNPAHDYIALRVKGDSMYPKYLEGDTILVKLCPKPENRRDCVVYVNGCDATLKTVIQNPDGTVTLEPFNRQYPPKTYRKEKDHLTILGEVVELRRTI